MTTPRWRTRLAQSFAILLFIVLLVVLARFDALVTLVARRRAAARGITCDARFRADVAWNLRSVSLAPCACDVAMGPVARLELLGKTTLTLDFWQVETVTLSHLRLERRGGWLMRAGSGHMELDALHVPGRVAALGAAIAYLASIEAPVMQASLVELVHGAEVELRLDDVLVRGSASDKQASLRFVELPITGGSIDPSSRADMYDVRVQATPNAARVEGGLYVFVRRSSALRDDLRGDAAASLELTPLDSAHPSVRFHWAPPRHLQAVE